MKVQQKNSQGTTDEDLTTEKTNGAAGGQVVNAVVDQSGTVLNYSTNTAPMMQQRTVMGQVQQRAGQPMGVQQKSGKPVKDPNAPKKPLSAYFLFSQDERLKVKAEFPDYSITEVAKELGRRWATIDPAIKQSYEQRYQESRRQYEQALQVNNFKYDFYKRFITF